jgi:hypothetical protein
MKLTEFLPELKWYVKIRLDRKLHIEGKITEITGKTFKVKDRAIELEFKRDNTSYEILEVRNEYNNLVYMYASEEIFQRIDKLKEMKSERKKYMQDLFDEGFGPITKEDVADVMEDIDLYNGICEQRRRHE